MQKSLNVIPAYAKSIPFGGIFNTLSDPVLAGATDPVSAAKASSHKNY